MRDAVGCAVVLVMLSSATVSRASDDACVALWRGDESRRLQCIKDLIRDLAKPEVAPAAMSDLNGMGESAVDELLLATRDERSLVRANAADVLGRIGQRSNEPNRIVCRLTELLRDPDRLVVLRTALALAIAAKDSCDAKSALADTRAAADVGDSVLLRALDAAIAAISSASVTR